MQVLDLTTLIRQTISRNSCLSYQSYISRSLAKQRYADCRTFQIRSSPPLLIATFMMIGACQSTIRGARAFAVDLIEVVRRTISDLFEMDSVNVCEDSSVFRLTTSYETQIFCTCLY